MTQSSDEKQIFFLSLMIERYSRTWTYFRALQIRGFTCHYHQIKTNTILSELWKIRKQVRNLNSVVVIGSASQLIAFPAKIILGKRITLDAGWSLTESTLVNSKRRGLLRTKLVKNYFIDLIASTVASSILVESKAQLIWYKNHFPFTKNKCHFIYTGLDETDFIPEKKIRSKQSSDFTVIFRGKDNDEAGLKVLAQATLILAKENIRFIVVSNPRKEIKFPLEKTQVIDRYFDNKSDITHYYKISDLSLGQLSGHNRLKRTIPHKAFESAYLGIPYLTARNEGILEIFNEGEEVFCFDPGNPRDLAEKILYLSKNQNLLSVSAEKIKAKYEKDLSQEKLGINFLSLINS